MNIFIIGGKIEVYFLSKSFLSKGYQVTIINQDEAFSKKISRNLKVTAVVGDGSKPYVLEEAGIAYADMVIALRENDSDNLVICQIANKIYGIKRTFAVVNDPQNIDIFKKLGVDTVISTSFIISSLIEQRAVTQDIQNLMPIGEGQIALMEVDIDASHPVVDKMIKDISFPSDAIVSCILRGDKAIIPKGNTMVLSQDRLVIMSQPEVQSEVLKIIRGRVD